MAAVGRVTVSLRRSIMGRLPLSEGSVTRLGGGGGSLGLLQLRPVLVEGLGHAGGHVVGIGGADHAGALVQQDVDAVVLHVLCDHGLQFLLDRGQQFLLALLEDLLHFVGALLQFTVGVLVLREELLVACGLGIGLVQLILEGHGLLALVVQTGLGLVLGGGGLQRRFGLLAAVGIGDHRLYIHHGDLGAGAGGLGGGKHEQAGRDQRGGEESMTHDLILLG